MTHFPTPEHERLARTGMYHPEMESDACGVGLVAAIDALKAVWGIRDGRDVTEHMHRYLREKAKAERVAA